MRHQPAYGFASAAIALPVRSCSFLSVRLPCAHECNRTVKRRTRFASHILYGTLHREIALWHCSMPATNCQTRLCVVTEPVMFWIPYDGNRTQRCTHTLRARGKPCSLSVVITSVTWSLLFTSLCTTASSYEMVIRQADCPDKSIEVQTHHSTLNAARPLRLNQLEASKDCAESAKDELFAKPCRLASDNIKCWRCGWNPASV